MKKEEIEMQPTSRQLEIIKLLYKGYSWREISEELKISTKTVNVHINQAKERLRINNTAELISTAVRAGLIHLEPLPQGSFPALTPRETKVIKLICEGHTLEEIAEILKIGHSTVQGYNRKMLVKLRLHSSRQLFAFALQTGTVR